MRMIVLENQMLRIAVLAGKGSDIVELNYKPLDLDFVWLNAGGVQNPVPFAPTSLDARAAFRDNYPGGWQEILPNGGHPSTYQGAQHNQHGEVFNVPWDVSIVEDTQELVAVRFVVRTRKSPLLLERTLSLRSAARGFQLDERLVNESPVAMRAMWGHHITFGQPFLKPGCHILLPDGLTVTPHPEPVGPGGRRISGSAPFTWPTDPENAVNLATIPDRGSLSELVYLSGFQQDEAWYQIVDPVTEIGARVEWDANVMPYLWYWQEFGASIGYPWYGRNYNIGLEPFSSMPSLGLAEAVNNDTALTIPPASTLTFQLKYSVIQSR
jgi:hypothetical protein